MVFDSLFKKAQPAEKQQQKNILQNAPPQKTEKSERALNFAELERSFEKEMESPENLIAEDILKTPGSAPPTAPMFQARAQPQVQAKPAQKPMQMQQPQKIPAFVSLDKYKEIRLSLRDMKQASLEMRHTLENLRKNRDDGTNLLNTTVGGLERIEGNIDKIRGVLRT